MLERSSKFGVGSSGQCAIPLVNGTETSIHAFDPAAKVIAPLRSVKRSGVVADKLAE